MLRNIGFEKLLPYSEMAAVVSPRALRKPKHVIAFHVNPWRVLLMEHDVAHRKCQAVATDPSLIELRRTLGRQVNTRIFLELII